MIAGLGSSRLQRSGRIAEVDSEAKVYTFAIWPLPSELGFQFSEKDQGDYLMQTTSNAAAVDKTTDKTPEKTAPAKLSEKVAEKRRALGRGLESLLPGPRVVPASPTLPQSTRKDGAPDSSSSSSSSGAES